MMKISKELHLIFYKKKSILGLSVNFSWLEVGCTPLFHSFIILSQGNVYFNDKFLFQLFLFDALLFSVARTRYN